MAVYDALDRLSKKRQDSPTGTLIAEYLYDAAGQKGLLQKSLAYASQGTVEVYNVAYDARNRLTQQNWTVPGTGGGTFRFDYAYNAAGQVTEQRLDQSPNGLLRQYVYETNPLRLNTARAGTASPWTNRQNLSYTYDNIGNITSLTDGVNSGQKQCFQYDWLSRLTAAFTGNSDCTAYSATGTGPYNHSYVYNAIGNPSSGSGQASRPTMATPTPTAASPMP